MDTFQKKIRELKIRLEAVQRAERYCRELARNRSQHQAHLERLAGEMDREHREMVELEKWSVKELFVKVINKEEQLEKEKEEYLQAAIAYQEAKKEIELLDFEIEVLQEKISGREKIEAALQRLYEQRESEILTREEDHPLKPVLAELARWHQIDRELEEAILHGAEVQLILEAIAQHLIRAKNWFNNGMRDYSYTIRMIAEEADQARLRLPKLRLEYVKFEQEIREVFQYPELESWQHDQWNGLQQVQQLTQELGRFTQDFLRGLANSLNLPHQLHQAHTLADNLRHQTETSVKWLRLEREKVRQEIGRLEQTKQELLGN